jgi:hypothetical protein
MSEVIRKAVFDIKSGKLLWRIVETYDGPWERCKESDAQKKAQQEQNDFNNVLLATYKQSFAQSEAILGIIVPQLEHMATSPEGFGAPEYAALQAKIVNDTGAQFSSVAKAAAREFVTTNEKGLPSGVEAQVQGNIAAAAASQVAGETSQLAIANEEVKQRQKDFALSALTGIRSGLAQEGVATGGTTETGVRSSFDEATTVYNQGSMWKNILSGVVGAGLNFATGGLSGVLQGGGFLAGGGQALGGATVTG